MKTTLHPAAERGYANHGWLEARHSFSFAHWYDPSRIHFGALRVLNDDIVAGGMGFGMHPHDNMEIITIPLEGALEHKDSMGNHGIIRAGDVQVMSAGTGVRHSEYNHYNDREVKLFQIWIFSDAKGHQPRYDQRSFPLEDRQNRWQTVVSPDGSEGLMIHQNAWISLAKLDSGSSLSYQLKKPGNGIYLMTVEGTIEAGGIELARRDAAGFEDTDSLEIRTAAGAEILLLEIPMKF